MEGIREGYLVVVITKFVHRMGNERTNRCGKCGKEFARREMVARTRYKRYCPTCLKYANGEPMFEGIEQPRFQSMAET